MTWWHISSGHEKNSMMSHDDKNRTKCTNQRRGFAFKCCVFFQVCFYFFLMQITKIPRRSLFELFRHFWRRFVDNRNESRWPLAICARHSAIIYTWGMKSPISALFRTHLLYFWLPNFSFTNKLKWWMIFYLILLQIIRRHSLQFFLLIFCLKSRHILRK